MDRSCSKLSFQKGIINYLHFQIWWFDLLVSKPSLFILVKASWNSINIIVKDPSTSITLTYGTQLQMLKWHMVHRHIHNFQCKHEFSTLNAWKDFPFFFSITYMVYNITVLMKLQNAKFSLQSQHLITHQYWTAITKSSWETNFYVYSQLAIHPALTL